MRDSRKGLQYENISKDIVWLVLNDRKEGYERLLSHFDNYTNKLCLKKTNPEYTDKQFYIVDEDKKQVLQMAIIKGARDFAKLLLKERH